MFNKERLKPENLKQTWPLLYFFIYMPWFMLLEKSYPADYPGLHIIHIPLDDVLPFNEWFIIPYILWFLYIPVVFIFIYFQGKNEFYRLCAYEFLGMTICLVICSVYPNGLNLRINPADISHNFLGSIVRFLYTTDTPTNVLPSIHVFATISAHICLVHSQGLKSKVGKRIKIGSLILTICICLSTIFLKQHSIVDLVTGALLSFVLYFVIFKIAFKNFDFGESKE